MTNQPTAPRDLVILGDDVAQVAALEPCPACGERPGILVTDDLVWDVARAHTLDCPHSGHKGDVIPLRSRKGNR